MPAVQQQFETLFCFMCDAAVEEGEQYESAHEDCVDQHVFECESCGCLYVNSANVSRSDGIRISDITDYPMSWTYHTHDNLITCDDCVSMCENCDASWSSWELADECCGTSQSVNSYSYRPQFRFYKSPTEWSNYPDNDVLYMGIELEMVRVASCAGYFVEHAGESIDDPEFFYFKEDASIGHDGAELVTMPATLSAFEQMFPFETLDWARTAYRVRSFEYSSCGFHIHVARTAFTATHLWRFVTFQLKNPELCQFVAQRDSSDYASWHFEQSERESIPEYVKGKKANRRRYLAMNFQNATTIELRYFKGNILKSAILKNMQFVDSLYNYTKHMTYLQALRGGLTAELYKNWLSVQPGYDELKQYLMSTDNGGI